MTDVLANLKEQLAAEEARAANARAAAEDFRVAIAALEERRSAPSPSAPQRDMVSKPKRRKRGQIMRVILESVREGRGTRKQIDQACQDAGLELSSNSITNAVYRLSSHIAWRDDRYIIRTGEDSRTALMRDLQESADKLEGSKIVTLKPSERNGAAGVHPPTTALQTAST